MSDDKTTPPIKLGPEELDKLLKDFSDFQKKMDQLLKGEDPFREDKKDGGRVGMGSLMDKAITQDVNTLRENFLAKMYEAKQSKPRLKLAQGSSPIDDEILELEMFVGISPSNWLEEQYITEMRDRLNYLYKLKDKDSKWKKIHGN